MYAPQYTEHLDGYRDNGDANPYSHNVAQPRQKWYTEDPTVRRRAEEYSTLRQDIQRRDTETRFVERLGGKTRVITQSQKHTPTIRPWVTVITPHQEYSAPNAVYAAEHRERPRRHEGLQAQSRSEWPLPYGQPRVETHNAVHEYIAYSEESSHEDSVSDAGSDVSFTFDLSFHKTGPEGEEHGATVSGSSDKSGNKESEKSTTTDGNKRSPYNETVYSVLRSRYTGDIYARGDTVAELTTEQNQGSSKRDPLPLLRWIHLESQYPSFASFLEYVLKVHRLDEDERQDAIALLERTRETHERPILTPEGTKGKYLEPNFAEEIVYNRRLKVKKERSVQLLCIPYFCLAPYVAHSLSHASHLHPMRTLLQSSYSSAPKKRDLQQAVCKLDYPLKGHCFHVPQIWSLVLNNNLLITCAHLPASEIQRGLINIQLLPSPMEHKKSFDLHVSDGGSRTWLLPAENCTTWLEFTANFIDLSIKFDDDYEVVYKGVVRRVDDWVAMIAQAQETTIYLSLRTKRTNHIIERHPSVSGSEDEDSASVSSINSDIRNDSIETSGHNSAKKSDLKTTSKFLSDPMAYNDEATIQSQQDNTSSAPNAPRTKPSEASNPESTPTNSRAKMQESLNNFHLFLWLTAVSEKADNPEGNSENGSKGDNNIKDTQRANSIGRSFDVNTDRLDSLFSDMQHFIYSAKSKKRSAYKQCPSFTVQEVEAQLAQIERKGEEEDRKGREERRDTESRNRDGREKRSRGRGSRDRGSRNRDGRDRGSRDRGSRNRGSRNRGSRNRGSRNRGSRDRASRDRGSRDRDGRDKGSRGRGSRDRGSRNRASRDSGSRGRGDRDRRSRGRSHDRRSAFRKVAYSHNSEIRFDEREWHETSRRKRENTERERYNIGRGSPERRRVKARKNKKKFVRTAKQLFQFFLPLHYTSGMIMKYWGAVYYLIDGDDERFKKFYEHLQYTTTPSSLSRLLKTIAYDLSQGRGPLPWNITLPDEFGKAWLHLVMCFVLSTAEHSQDRLLAAEEFRRCNELVSKGRKELRRNMVNTSLQEKEAALPLGIMSLIVKKLLEDVTFGQPDVCSTYYEYLKRLEHEVQVNPYSRAHQEKISFLRQEIECILKVLNDQLSCLTDLHSKIGQGTIETPGRFPREREFYILHESIFSVNAKIQSFTEMAILASDLGIFNIRRIESNKDRQEAAILVFTIVTIIFLPLSFVSSFLGMNTTDIRNMDTHQWLFWACAIPLTTVVVGLSLLVANKVEPARQAWGRLLDRWAAVGPDTSGHPAPMAKQNFRPEPVAAYPPPPRYGEYEEPGPLKRRVTRQTLYA